MNARARSWHDAALLVVFCLACDAGAAAPTLDLPSRPDDAPGGTEIGSDIRELDLTGREERIYAEIARGNVPGWLRELRRVDISGEVNGRHHDVTFWVTPDYLAVGATHDFLLMPLSARTAYRVADLVGASLPTPRMVDAIWSEADVRVDPIRLRPDEFMKSVHYIERHDNLIRAQRIIYHIVPGAFVAGNKLDLVLTASLAANPGKVALYGWHRSDGRPVQKRFVGATDSLVVFSHGVRLVHRRVIVDGVTRDLRDVLRDPEIAPVLSDDGVIELVQ